MNAYITDMQGKRFQGTENDALGNYTSIAHECPFCGKEASKGRSLVWIAGECIQKGHAVFPCISCSKWVKVPFQIFALGCLRKLKETPSVQATLSTMPLKQVLNPNWGNLILTANKGGPIDVSAMEWDRRGSCPGCGQDHINQVSIQVKCVFCNNRYWVNQVNISTKGNTNVQCNECGRIMIIPPSVWCPVCGENLQASSVIDDLIVEANTQKTKQKEEETSSPAPPSHKKPASRKWWKFW